MLQIVFMYIEMFVGYRCDNFIIGQSEETQLII